MDDDEYVWVEGPFKNNPPALNHKLKSFEEDALRCPSCREFYTNAVTLRPCHHTFCSQCIRRSLATRNGVKDKQCCPICRTNLEIITPSGIKKQLKEEDAIIPNYGLQKAVDEYKAIKDLMKDTLLELQNLRQLAAIKNEMGKRKTSEDMMTGEDSSKKGDVSQVDDPNSSVGVGEGESSATNDIIVRETTSKRPRRSSRKAKTYAEAEEIFDETDSQSDKKTSMIDPIHEEKTQDTIVDTVRLEQKRFVLTGMKEKQLRELCRKEGISTIGKELQLKARIKRFGDFWKSECDGENHRPADVILKEFKKAEALRDAEEKKIKMWGSKGKVGSIKEMELSKLTPEMKSGFAKLLNQAGGKRRPPRKRSPYDANSGESTQCETNEAPGDQIHSEDSRDSSNTAGSSLVTSSTASLSPPPPYVVDVVNPSSTSHSEATNSSTSNETKRVVNPYKRKLPPSGSTNTPKRMINPYRKKSPNRTSSIKGKTVTWKCGMCTYVNKVVLFTDKAPKCKICGTVKAESAVEVVTLDC